MTTSELRAASLDMLAVLVGVTAGAGLAGLLAGGAIYWWMSA